MYLCACVPVGRQNRVEREMRAGKNRQQETDTQIYIRQDLLLCPPVTVSNSTARTFLFPKTRFFDLSARYRSSTNSDSLASASSENFYAPLVLRVTGTTTLSCLCVCECLRASVRWCVRDR